jgi:hypothetical protein
MEAQPHVSMRLIGKAETYRTEGGKAEWLEDEVARFTIGGSLRLGVCWLTERGQAHLPNPEII